MWGGSCRPFGWESVSVAAPTAALGQRVVEGLSRGGGSSGHVCNHLWIEGCVCVGHDGIVTAAAPLRLDLDFPCQVGLNSRDILTGQGEAVLRPLIVHSLVAQP